MSTFASRVEEQLRMVNYDKDRFNAWSENHFDVASSLPAELHVVLPFGAEMQALCRSMCESLFICNRRFQLILQINQFRPSKDNLTAESKVLWDAITGNAKQIFNSGKQMMVSSAKFMYHFRMLGFTLAKYCDDRRRGITVGNSIANLVHQAEEFEELEQIVKAMAKEIDQNIVHTLDQLLQTQGSETARTVETSKADAYARRKEQEKERDEVMQFYDQQMFEIRQEIARKFGEQAAVQVAAEFIKKQMEIGTNRLTEANRRAETALNKAADADDYSTEEYQYKRSYYGWRWWRWGDSTVKTGTKQIRTGNKERAEKDAKKQEDKVKEAETMAKATQQELQNTTGKETELKTTIEDLKERLTMLEQERNYKMTPITKQLQEIDEEIQRIDQRFKSLLQESGTSTATHAVKVFELCSSLLQSTVQTGTTTVKLAATMTGFSRMIRRTLDQVNEPLALQGTLRRCLKNDPSLSKVIPALEEQGYCHSRQLQLEDKSEFNELLEEIYNSEKWTEGARLTGNERRKLAAMCGVDLKAAKPRKKDTRKPDQPLEPLLTGTLKSKVLPILQAQDMTTLSHIQIDEEQDDFEDWVESVIYKHELWKQGKTLPGGVLIKLQKLCLCGIKSDDDDHNDPKKQRQLQKQLKIASLDEFCNGAAVFFKELVPRLEVVDNYLGIGNSTGNADTDGISQLPSLPPTKPPQFKMIEAPAVPITANQNTVHPTIVEEPE